MRRAIPISLAFIFALSIASFSNLCNNSTGRNTGKSRGAKAQEKPAASKPQNPVLEIWAEDAAARHFGFVQTGAVKRSKLLPNGKDARFGQKLHVQNFANDAMIECIFEKTGRKTGRVHLKISKGSVIIGQKCIRFPFGENKSARVTLLFRKGKLQRADQMSPNKTLYLITKTRARNQKGAGF